MITHKKYKASQKNPKTEQKQERPRKSILMAASFINYKNNVCLKKATNIIEITEEKFKELK